MSSFIKLIVLALAAARVRLLGHAFNVQPIINTFKSSSALGVTKSPSNLVGKFIAQRYIYKLSPNDSSTVSPYSIEERNMYIVGPDGTLDPMNLKSFFVRNEHYVDTTNLTSSSLPNLSKNGRQRTFLPVGRVVHKLENIHEGDRSSEHPGGGKAGLGESIWDSAFVTALYCAAYPQLFHGKVLELGSGVGIGGILTCISCSHAFNQSNVQHVTSETGTHVESVITPQLLDKLYLTDINEPSLNMCRDNLSSFPLSSSKVEVASLDWHSRLPSSWHGQFQFIIASDCCYYFPLVNALARTIAHSLAPSPYNALTNNQDVGGLFLHIGPEHRDTVKDLRKKLDHGYRMKTWTESNIVLERFSLVPLVLDTLDSEDEILSEESSRGYVEYHDVDTSRFSALLGHHHEDYDGANADYFFPTEIGSEN